MNARQMLIPKGLNRPRWPTVRLPYAHDLGSRERRAVRGLVEDADVFMVDDQAYILAPVSQETLDHLAVFEAEREDCEDSDEDDDTENEPSLGATEAIHQDAAWRADIRRSFDLEWEHDGREDQGDEEPDLDPL